MRGAGTPNRLPRPGLRCFSSGGRKLVILADAALRTELFDALKFIPLSDDGTAYLSFGAKIVSHRLV
jgi:hypothetical protein